MKNTLRPLGDVLLEIEPLLEEMTDSHGLQYGDIMSLIYSWLEVHRPGSKEVYVSDGSSPKFTYAPEEK